MGKLERIFYEIFTLNFFLGPKKMAINPTNNYSYTYPDLASINPIPQPGPGGGWGMYPSPSPAPTKTNAWDEGVLPKMEYKIKITKGENGLILDIDGKLFIAENTMELHELIVDKVLSQFGEKD